MVALASGVGGYVVPHKRSGPVDNLLYFVFEFQPIAHAVPRGGSPRVERRGQIYLKSKVNNGTGGNSILQRKMISIS